MSRSKAKIHTLSGPKFCSKEMGNEPCRFLLFVGTPRAQADEC